MRLFIAVELTDQVRGELDRFQTTIRTVTENGIKYPPKENLHLTLKFLGTVSDEKLDGVKESLVQAARFRPFEITLSGGGYFPEHGKLRVIWAGIRDENKVLTSIVENLDQTLASLGFAPEDREFSPHITVGRIKKALPEKEAMKRKILGYSPAPVSQEVNSISLIESKLSSSGASYSTIYRADLMF